MTKNISNFESLCLKLEYPYYHIEHCLVELYQFSDNDTKILAYYHASRACLVENLPCLAQLSRQAYLSKKLVLTFYVGEQLQLAFLRNFIKGNRDVKNDSVHIATEMFFLFILSVATTYGILLVKKKPILGHSLASLLHRLGLVPF